MLRPIKLISIFAVLFRFFVSSLSAQEITEGEYFIDKDPGVGKGNSIEISDGDTICENLSISSNSIEPGYHYLYIRTKDNDNQWSIMSRKSFYIYKTLAESAPSQANLSSAEYFIDKDPGAGKGESINISNNAAITKDLDIDTDKLKKGYHHLYIRTKDKNERWGIPFRRSFYIYDTSKNIIPSKPKLTAAEYFIDKDPGVGNGDSINIGSLNSISKAVSINTANLKTGYHKLYIRTRDLSGRWSIASRRTFYVIDTSLNEQISRPKLTAAEYFLDKDPGVGNGNNINLSELDSINKKVSINIDTLTKGYHQFYIRTKDLDGNWSIASRNQIYVYDTLNNKRVSKPIPHAAEYYVDSDPGKGNGHSVNVAALDSIGKIEKIATDTLKEGYHQLFVRKKNKEGNWLPKGNKSFYVYDTVLDKNNIIKPAKKAPVVAAEYFIDQDPGPGKGNAISVNEADSIHIKKAIEITNIDTGKHYIYIRTKDSVGNWSITKRLQFEVIENNCNLEASFQSSSIICKSDLVEITDQSSSVSNETKYKWDINNDGQINYTTRENTFYHKFSDTGTYDIQLKIVNDQFCSDSTINTVKVEKCGSCKLLADFQGQSSICKSDSLQLIDQSSSVTSKTQYKWDIGNNGKINYTAKEDTLYHEFSDTGTYPVQLILINDQQCGDSIIKNVKVKRCGECTQSQTVSFDTTYNKKSVNAPDFELSATTSSGLPVNYTVVEGPAEINDSIVDLKGDTGKVTIRARQPGNSVYCPAESFTTIKVVSQIITFKDIKDHRIGEGPVIPEVSSTSGLPVSIRIVKGPASLEGDFINGYKIRLESSGNVVLEAYQEGNSIYGPAKPVQQSFAVFDTGTSICSEPPPQVSDKSLCGSGKITFKPSGAKSYNFYEQQTGGAPVNGGNDVTSFTTPKLDSTKTYYVSAIYDKCESSLRTAVNARIINPSKPDVKDTIKQCNPGTVKIVPFSGGNLYNFYKNKEITQTLQGGKNVKFYTTDTINEDTSFFISSVIDECESNQRKKVTVDITLETDSPPNAPDVSLLERACEGDSLKLSATSEVGSATYSWEGPDNFTANVANPVIENVTKENSGNYWVRLVKGNCKGKIASVSVNIGEAPQKPEIIPTSKVLCNENANTSIVVASDYESYQWYKGNDKIVGDSNKVYFPVTEGNYRVKVGHEKNKCKTFSKPVEISLKEGTEKPKITNQGDSILSATKAEKYQWYVNERLIPGATGKNYQVKHNGIYYVYATFKGGCRRISNKIVIDNPGYNDIPKTGLADINHEDKNKMRFTIKPNPAKNHFKIIYKGNKDIKLIQLVSSKGIIVKHLQHKLFYDNAKMHINTKKVAAGLYFLRIYTKDQSFVKKVIIK